MDKLEKYRSYIKQLITEHAELCSSTKEIDAQLIFDIEHDHYQLVDVGWQNQKRIHSCFLHLDIKDGKVWIQHNGTEDHIAYDLVAKGIPKEDIVLGFQAPDYRQYTDFAVN
jgi:hypothetical protein